MSQSEGDSVKETKTYKVCCGKKFSGDERRPAEFNGRIKIILHDETTPN